VVDPLAEMYYSISTFNYVGNKPLRYIDLDRKSMSLIYDLNGDFLGTDDKGLSRDFIVMDKKNFK
jgi:hypothetical protein